MKQEQEIVGIVFSEDLELTFGLSWTCAKTLVAIVHSKLSDCSWLKISISYL